MGRSVSYPSSSIHRIYLDVSYVGQCEDEDGTSYYCNDVASLDWGDLIDNLRAKLIAKLPSLYVSQKWLDNEDRCILENDLSYIGISEYCGVACLWCVPKDDNDGYHGYRQELSPAWCNRIYLHLQNAAIEAVGASNTLSKIATASNGESFYERKA